MKIYLYIITAGLLVAVGSAAANEKQNELPIQETFPATVPLDPMAVRSEPPTPLSVDRWDAFKEGVNIHDLGMLQEIEVIEADERAAKHFADVFPVPPRVGLARSIEWGPLSITRGDALLMDTDDGRNVWTFSVRSPEAYGVRVHFTGFDVGDGSVVVYAYDDNGAVIRGPYTERGPDGDGDFWTATLPGDEVFVEAIGADEPHFEIAEVIHFDQDLYGVEQGTRDGPPLLDCHLDVNCHMNEVAASAKNATGQMNFLCDGTSCHVCTGTLLNDNDSETTAPYFLTARHCLNTQAEVDTLEVVWQYETDSCNGVLPNYSTLPRNVGGVHLKSESENDMELIWLGGSLPGGVSLAGWSTDTASGQYGVHHPKGSWKRVVFLSHPSVECPTFDPWDYDSYDMIDGLTQGGSSGSGVFNSSGQLTGQLWGICSVTTDPDNLSCSNIDDFWAVYGQFETTYDEISWYLGIGGTLWVDGSYTGIYQFGTQANPFDAIQTALDIAWDGMRIKIKTGSYPDPITINQEVKLVAWDGTVTLGG
ncbi:MAG: hypothetical protein JSU63_16330 [Phycisphaerales bacterium]|nr:MAG: hypothetical protein JSU63_16330 [Phycisphaerales bacterium]